MPAKPRSEVFDPDEVGVYHCWNRLVRRRHLFGWDALTGKNYSYRKDWVRDRFRQLAAAMAIDVLDYAILDNHLHIVEDDVDGRFFAKRFDCERLETCADVLACSIYVDLNWIHAGMAETPERRRPVTVLQSDWRSTYFQQGLPAH